MCRLYGLCRHVPPSCAAVCCYVPFRAVMCRKPVGWPGSTISALSVTRLPTGIPGGVPWRRRCSVSRSALRAGASRATIRRIGGQLNGNASFTNRRGKRYGPCQASPLPLPGSVGCGVPACNRNLIATVAHGLQGADASQKRAGHRPSTEGTQCGLAGGTRHGRAQID